MPVTPERIMQIGWSHVPQRALTSAIDIGLFTAVANGADTLPALVAATGASERGVRMIADALAALEFLTKRDGRYGLTPDSEMYLVEGKETYLGPLVQHTNMLWDNFGKLTEAVRGGRPVVAVDQAADGQPFFLELVPMIFGNSYAQAQAGAAALGVGEALTGLHILDVAAGSAAWSLAFLRRDPTSTAVALDYAPVLEVARDFATRFGCAERYEFRPGNLRDTDFGEAAFDLVLLGHICHSEGAEASRALLAKCHRALKPGGRLLIGDMLPDEDRREAAFALLFAINMLVHTTDGDCFTPGGYTGWLEAAGFRSVETIENPGPSPLIVATA